MADIKEQVKDLRKQGKSFSQIANELGVSRGTVAGILNRAGMVGEQGTDKIEAKPAADVPNPPKGAFEPPATPLGQASAPGQAPAMRPMAIDPALNNLPQWPIGRAPAMQPSPSPYGPMPGNAPAMQATGNPNPGTAPGMQPMGNPFTRPGNAPGMQPIPAPPQGPLPAPTTPVLGNPTGPRVQQGPGNPWGGTGSIGGSGNGLGPAPTSVPNTAGGTPGSAPGGAGPWSSSPAPTLGQRLGAFLGQTPNLLWPAYDIATRPDVAPSVRSIANQRPHLGLLDTLTGHTSAPGTMGSEGAMAGKRPAGLFPPHELNPMPAADLPSDAPTPPAVAQTSGSNAATATVDKFDPNAPGQTQMDPTMQNPLLAASAAVPPSQAYNPNMWGTPSSQPNISATTQAPPPQRVQPFSVPASQVPSQPIGGQNPYQLGQQQPQGGPSGPTPPPNTGINRGNPISNLVSGIIQLPANVVKGVVQGLQAYTNPNAWTNTPSQISQMSDNVAAGLPPASQPNSQGLTASVMSPGMTPPPNTGTQPGSWVDWNG